jgi:hypothetical protein
MSLPRALIYVDDLVYSGEDPDGDGGPAATLVSNAGGGGAWHDFATNKRIGALLFGGEPHILIGVVNIKSTIDKIMERVRRKGLSPWEIRIVFLDPE